MHVEFHGSPDAPAILLSSGLGGAAHYWAPQISALAAEYRVIAYDHLGTGRSPGALPRDYAIADMAAEAAEILQSHGVSRCHFMGHALGGLIGLRLAADHPDLVDRLILVNAWAKTHPHTIRCFEARRSLLLNTGAEAYVRAQPLFLYPADWLANRQDWLADQDRAALSHFPGIEATLRRIEAVLRFDITAEAASIQAKAMLFAARDDVLVPSGCSLALAELLPQAALRVFDRGAHACNLTDPEGFNEALLEFLRDD